MKRIFTTALSVLLIYGSAYSQGEVDALTFSRNELTGTARSVGMGGAFGALGGDMGGVAINPAGIGVYSQSEVMATLSFRNNKTETELNAGKIDKSKFNFNFSNFGVVGVIPIDNDIVPKFNFGFSYNRIKDFNRKYESQGSNLNSSLADFMADRANASGASAITGSRPFENAEWLGVLGYKGGLINANDKGLFGRTQGGNVNNRLYVREKGAIESYDFTAGTTFANVLSFGVTLSVTDFDHRLYSDYQEDYKSNNSNFYLENWLKTEGTGYQVTAGLILKPINEVRIGVAYHSPTWYEMTDYYSAALDALGKPVIDTYYEAGNTYTDYDFRTPDKWSFSLAGILGKRVILSADYELTNYKNMKYRNTDRFSSLSDHNEYIKHDYKNASTLRVGTEIRITPQFSGRLGYAWMESPLQKDFKNMKRDVVTVGTIAHFAQEGDANYFTWGLGYVFNSNFYTDIAFAIKTQKDDLYSFSKLYNDEGGVFLDSQKATLKNNQFTGLVTFGYRF